MPVAQRSFRNGIVVGLIGYAAVAVFYSIFDVLAARGALHTVNMLGLAVFRGVRDPAILQLPVATDFGAIMAYNALHLVLALVIGVIVVALVDLAEREPARRGVVRLVIVAGFVVTVVAVGVLTAPMRPVLPWWSIIVANAFAVALAGSYLVRRNPGLMDRLAFSGA